MAEWLVKSIGQLCDEGLAKIQTGPFGSQLHAYEYVPSGIPVVPTEAIRARRIDHSVLPKIRKEKADELKRHRLIPGDILFARRGVQATGHTAYVRDEEEGLICGTGAIRLRIKPPFRSVLPEFLSHVFANPASVDWFKFHAIGATMPNLNEGIICSFPLLLPPIVDQQAIASLLSALDDKIDLNRQMNETLAAMARVIFKDWFVNFGPTRAKAEGRPPYLAPELWSLFPTALDDEDKPMGWRIGRLGDVAEGLTRTIDPGEVAPDTPYIGLEHMPRQSVALESWEGAGKVTSGKLKFLAGEFLFGKLRPYFHKVGIAPLEGICSTDIVVCKPKKKTAYAFVLAHISSDEFVAYTDRTSTGTKMPRTSWSLMAQFENTMPPDPILDAFNSIVMPLTDRLMANIHESRTLAELRDLLLPRLMSGEICLQEAEKLVGEGV